MYVQFSETILETSSEDLVRSKLQWTSQSLAIAPRKNVVFKDSSDELQKLVLPRLGVADCELVRRTVDQIELNAQHLATLVIWDQFVL